MAVDFDTPQDASVGSLLGSIVQDTRQLIVDQMNLFRVELKRDVTQAISALIPIGLGVLVLFTAQLLLGFGLAYLFVWWFPDLPQFAGFLIVGGVVAVIGALLVASGIYTIKSIKPAATALQGLEENVKWKTKNN
jgi:uncharacterized membrane protein YqjE